MPSDMRGMSNALLSPPTGPDMRGLLGISSTREVGPDMIGFPIAETPDPYIGSVVMLCVGAGSDGSTTIIDSSKYGHSMTSVGNIQVTTSGPVAGRNAVLLDGTGDYAWTNTAAELMLTSGDWTIEVIEWHAAFAPGYFCGKFDTGGGVGQYYMYNNSSQFIGTVWYQNFTSNGGQSNTAAPNSVWNHLAFSRYGNTYLISQNGLTSIIGTPDSRPLLVSTPDKFYLGSLSGSQSYNGKFQLRVTKGVCRYPSTQPSTAQAYTAPLYFPTS